MDDHDKETARIFRELRVPDRMKAGPWGPVLFAVCEMVERECSRSLPPPPLHRVDPGQDRKPDPTTTPTPTPTPAQPPKA